MKQILRHPILLLIITLTTLNSTNSEFCDGNTFTLSETGNTSIHLVKGVTFNIKIPGNPNTGHIYYLSNRKDISTSVLQPLNLTTKGSAEYQPHPAYGMVNSGGFYCFRFLAKEQVENMAVGFEYKRSWEPTPVDSKVALITIG